MNSKSSNPFEYAGYESTRRGWVAIRPHINDNQLLIMRMVKSHYTLTFSCGVNPHLHCSFKYQGNMYHRGEVIMRDFDTVHNPININTSILKIWANRKLNTREIEPISLAVGLSGPISDELIKLSQMMGDNELLYRYAKLVKTDTIGLIQVDFATINILNQFFTTLDKCILDDGTKTSWNKFDDAVAKPKSKPVKPKLSSECSDKIDMMDASKHLADRTFEIAASMKHQQPEYVSDLLAKHFAMEDSGGCFMCDSTTHKITWTCDSCKDKCCVKCSKYASATICSTTGKMLCEECQ